MKVTLHALIKIGKKRDMEDLLKNGTIYMKPFSFFRNIEDNGLRGDPDKGMSDIKQLDNLTLYIGGKKFPIHKLSKEYSIQFKARELKLSGNIYSLFSISSLEDFQKFKIDEKNMGFGKYFVIIHNTREFMNRIQKKITELKYDLEFDLVKYYNDKSYSGKLGIFHKPDNYSYQKEFRLFIKREENSPLSFRIGSIEDISVVFKSEILETIKIDNSI